MLCYKRGIIIVTFKMSAFEMCICAAGFEPAKSSFKIAFEKHYYFPGAYCGHDDEREKSTGLEERICIAKHLRQIFSTV